MNASQLTLTTKLISINMNIIQSNINNTLLLTLYNITKQIDALLSTAYFV